MAAPHALTFAQTSSNPGEHLHLESFPDPSQEELAATSVLVKLLVAAINPQDLLVLTGRYPVQPLYQLPGGRGHVAGFDGVAEVVRCGTAVDMLRPGDRVIPKRHGLGTWRPVAVWPAADLHRITPQIDVAAAAVLRMSALPAFLLLEDMCRLKPGDWLIQNAGSSAIAQLVVQLARLRGVHSVSVIRDGPGAAATKVALAGMGAAVVLTESQLDNADDVAALDLKAGGKRFVLALDAVFGRSGEKIAAVLSPGGLLVNYGSLGGSTFTLTQEVLFWKRIQLRNFRLSEQLGARTQSEQDDALRWLEQLFVAGRLAPPVLQSVRWDAQVLRNVVEAVTTAEVGARKKLLVFV
ncbi:hypothetical protein BKA65DRAFT_562760 [Rhexocercosporidium sp. MPI-PUGE-AT-0058]|nr:hypothetical protein BKA65DRAFT_562760 [Rhexocercosporidium sp. MPI-PUGE-AT-0058]